MVLQLNMGDIIFLLLKMCTRTLECMSLYFLILFVFRHDFRGMIVFHKVFNASVFAGIVLAICSRIFDIHGIPFTLIHVSMVYLFLVYSFKFKRYESALMILATYVIHYVPEYFILFSISIIHDDSIKQVFQKYPHSISYLKDLLPFFLTLYIGITLHHKHIGYTLTFKDVKLKDWFKSKYFICICSSFVCYLIGVLLYTLNLIGEEIGLLLLIVLSVCNIYTLYCKNKKQIISRHF
jgi:hypothetical protein